MIYYYADVLTDGRVRACFNYEGPDDGPLEPHWESQAEGDVVLLDKPISWAGPSPTSILYWSESKGLYWVETSSIDELKQKKRQEITACRIAADNDHFTYQDKMIRTADKDMFDLLVADARINKCTDGQMPPNWPGGWKAMDNSYLPITTPDAWNAFFIAAYDAGIGNFMKSQFLKQQIEDATTFQEVEAVKW